MVVCVGIFAAERWTFFFCVASGTSRVCVIAALGHIYKLCKIVHRQDGLTDVYLLMLPSNSGKQVGCRGNLVVPPFLCLCLLCWGLWPMASELVGSLLKIWACVASLVEQLKRWERTKFLASNSVLAKSF